MLTSGESAHQRAPETGFPVSSWRAAARWGMSNHSEFDDAYTKGRLLASRGPGKPNPFEVGRESVAHYFKTSNECAQAALLEYK